MYFLEMWICGDSLYVHLVKDSRFNGRRACLTNPEKSRAPGVWTRSLISILTFILVIQSVTVNRDA